MKLLNIPNIITCLNLISGCIATYWAFLGDYRMALLFIVIGAVFDFFDGMVARLLHVSSPIGKELDSLADDISTLTSVRLWDSSDCRHLPMPSSGEP